MTEMITMLFIKNTLWCSHRYVIWSKSKTLDIHMIPTCLPSLSSRSAACPSAAQRSTEETHIFTRLAELHSRRKFSCSLIRRKSCMDSVSLFPDFPLFTTDGGGKKNQNTHSEAGSIILRRSVWFNHKQVQKNLGQAIVVQQITYQVRFTYAHQKPRSIIHPPPIFKTHFILYTVTGCSCGWRLSLLSMGSREGTPWTGH